MTAIISSRPRRLRSDLSVAVVTVAALAAFVMPAARSDDSHPAEPSGYRLDNYRAPTPQTLRGARVVGTREAQAIWTRGNAAFVDVLPRAPKPRDLPPGTIWRDQPRLDIPGS